MAAAVDPLRSRYRDGLEITPLALGIDRLGGRNDRVGPRLLAAMPLLGGHVPLEVLSIPLGGDVDRRIDPLIQRRLIPLDRQDVVSLAATDLGGDLPSAAYRIDRH